MQSAYLNLSKVYRDDKAFALDLFVVTVTFSLCVFPGRCIKALFKSGLMANASLSVVIITKNEEDNIRECLESVSWVDEIVVVDSDSKDNTIAICKEYTDKIFINDDWKGFGYQKNLALQQATKDWVLSLDADERITSVLRIEIENVINNSAYSAFVIPRQAYFLGKAMKHGGWWPDYVVRLFRRNTFTQY